jgi:hypothetical protein
MVKPAQLAFLEKNFIGRWHSSFIKHDKVSFQSLSRRISAILRKQSKTQQDRDPSQHFASKQSTLAAASE